MNLLSTRLYPAIRLLVGPEPVKQRLVQVWLKYLDDIPASDLPRQVRDEFMELRRSMYARTPLPHETAPEASVRKMSIKEATQHAECIVNVLNLMADESGVIEFRSVRTKLPRVSETKSVVPAETPQSPHKSLLN
jgi:hypothetical protein